MTEPILSAQEEERKNRIRALQAQAAQLLGEVEAPTKVAPASLAPTPAPLASASAPAPIIPKSIAGSALLQKWADQAQKYIPVGATKYPLTLWEAAGKSPGVVPAIMDTLNRTLGQIPGVELDQSFTDARSMFRNARTHIVKAFSRNNRYTVQEMEKLEKELEPSMFDSDVALRTRLLRIDNLATAGIEAANKIDNSADLQDPVRLEAQQTAVAMQNLRTLIGVPEDAKGRFIEQRGQRERRGLVPSIPPKKDAMSEEEIRKREKEFGGIRLPSAVDGTGLGMALEVTPALVGGALGAAGGVIGGPLGAVGGMIVGGGLGAATGKDIRDSANAIENWIRYGDPDKRTWQQRAQAMANAAAADMAFGSVLAAPGRIASGALRGLGYLSGANAPAATKAMNEAASSGLHIGATDLGSDVSGGIAKVMGVIPYVGAPGRKAGAAKELEGSQEFVNIMDAISPKIDLTRLGIRFGKSAKQSWKAMQDLANAKYIDMKGFFTNIGDPVIIPTGPIKQVVNDSLEELRQLPRVKTASTRGTTTETVKDLDIRKKITTEIKGKVSEKKVRTEEQGKGVVTKKIFGQEKEAPVGFAPFEEKFAAELESFRGLPDKISFSKMEAIQKNLNAAIRAKKGDTVKANELRIIRKMNGATWDALDAIPVTEFSATLSDVATPRESAAILKEVISKIHGAKSGWRQLQAVEETTVGSTLKTVNDNIFGGYRVPGGANPDELANLFLSHQSTLRSPQFVRDLRVLIGKDNTKAFARMVLERAADPQAATAMVSKAVFPKRLLFPGKTEAKVGSAEVVDFDAAKMLQNLGLSNPEQLLGPTAMQKNRQSLNELLRGTNVSIERLEAFLHTVERQQETMLGKSSTFVTRRLMLSGTPKSLLPNVQAGAGIVALATLTPISLGSFVMAGRAMSRLVTSPHGLTLLREGLNPNLTKQQFLNLAQRVGRAFPDLEVKDIDMEQPMPATTPDL